MACGCPVLASNHGALGEIIGDAAALLDPENVGDIQTQLVRLAGNESEREALVAKGIAHAARFDWRRTAATTVEIYISAVTKSKGRGLKTSPVISTPDNAKSLSS